MFFCGDSEETVYHMISECSKQAQKEYKTWVRKVIYWELCMKLEVIQTTKWHIHKIESVLENVWQKIILDFEIKTDHLISAGWPDLLIINNNNNNK